MTYSNQDYIESYYSQTRAQNTILYPTLEEDIEIDTCVIGGGLAGLNTALGLAERGKKSCVIEANKIAWGASGRNGGFVSAGFTLGTSQLVPIFGLAQVQEMYALTRQSVQTVLERAKTAKYDCQLTYGKVEGHLWDKSISEPDHIAEYNEKFQTNYQYWSKQQTQEHYFTNAYKGATYDPEAFHFHPLNYSLSIAQKLHDQSVTIFENTPALSIQHKNNKVIIKTPKGIIKANQIVLSCSGYIHKLYPKLSRATMPITTYVLVTEPLGDRLQNSVTNLPHAVIDERISCDYWRPLPDGSSRLLWGGRITALPTAPSNVATIMRKSMLRIYPDLKDVQIETAWSGVMGYARHRMPMIGKINDQIWYNTGFGGHGMAATTLGGELIAAALAEKDEKYKFFDHFGLPYAGSFLGPFAAQSYYILQYLKDEFKIRRG